MKLSKNIAISALVSLLAACGGGGGDSSSDNGSSSSSSSSGSSSSSSSGGSSSGSTSSSSGSSGSGTNVVSILVDKGPSGVSNINLPFVTVKICEPGSSRCQTIDHILLDTGSTGLRILTSELNGSLNLPRVQTAGGSDMAECAAFIYGYTYGTVRQADVYLGEAKASAISVQMIGDIASVPATCSSRGGSQMKTPTDLGAKGILGTGWYDEDCPACTSSAISGAYYGCGTYSCSPVAVSIDRQVRNPVAVMSSHNNGIMVAMDSISSAGATTVSGKLYMGIGTADNNALGTATVLDLDANGNLKTTYQGTTMTAFVDSGSNGLFFPDDNIATCGSYTSAPGFFCPASTLNLSATMLGATNGRNKAISFSIGNADNLLKDNPDHVAFNNVGAPVDWATQFDWGLPFFYGRKVFVAIEGKDTAGGKGPYIGF